jgi:hypothetical protein
VTGFNQKVDDMIAGPAGCMVLATQAANGSAFIYTIGLIMHGFPELVIMGIGGIGHRPIMEAVRQIKANQKVPNPGDMFDIAELSDGTSARTGVGLVGQWALKEYLVQADHYAERKGLLLTARQLVIPDRNNVLPWEPGYDVEGMGTLQPCLNEDRSWPKVM